MGEQNLYEKKYREAIGKRISRAQAIRLKCLDCCVFQANEVKLCSSKECPLWRYRMGHEVKDDLYNRKGKKHE